jgi:hypothetical protein
MTKLSLNVSSDLDDARDGLAPMLSSRMLAAGQRNAMTTETEGSSTWSSRQSR